MAHFEIYDEDHDEWIDHALSPREAAEMVEKGHTLGLKSDRRVTCKEFAIGIGMDQAKTMGIPMTDEPLDDWKARHNAGAGPELPLCPNCHKHPIVSPEEMLAKYRCIGNRCKQCWIELAKVEFS